MGDSLQENEEKLRKREAKEETKVGKAPFFLSPQDLLNRRRGYANILIAACLRLRKLKNKKGKPQ